MEPGVFWTIIGTGVGIVTIIYTFLRNFKTDINAHIDAVTSRLDTHIKESKDENRKMDQRVMEANKRMDGVYNVLLKRTENLKG